MEALLEEYARASSYHLNAGITSWVRIFRLRISCAGDRSPPGLPHLLREHAEFHGPFRPRYCVALRAAVKAFRVIRCARLQCDRLRETRHSAAPRLQAGPGGAALARSRHHEHA